MTTAALSNKTAGKDSDIHQCPSQAGNPRRRLTCHQKM